MTLQAELQQRIIYYLFIIYLFLIYYIIYLFIILFLENNLNISQELIYL